MGWSDTRRMGRSLDSVVDEHARRRQPEPRAELRIWTVRACLLPAVRPRTRGGGLHVCGRRGHGDLCVRTAAWCAQPSRASREAGSSGDLRTSCGRAPRESWTNRQTATSSIASTGKKSPIWTPTGSLHRCSRSLSRRTTSLGSSRAWRRRCPSPTASSSPRHRQGEYEITFSTLVSGHPEGSGQRHRRSTPGDRGTTDDLNGAFRAPNGRSALARPAVVVSGARPDRRSVLARPGGYFAPRRRSSVVVTPPVRGGEATEHRAFTIGRSGTFDVDDLRAWLPHDRGHPADD